MHACTKMRWYSARTSLKSFISRNLVVSSWSLKEILMLYQKAFCYEIAKLWGVAILHSFKIAHKNILEFQLFAVYYKDVLENFRQILVEPFTISRKFFEIRFGQISTTVWEMFLNFEFGSTCPRTSILLQKVRK